MYRKRILWLASWYPNRKDRFDGDFIQRHARAAAINHDIHVLYITDTTQLDSQEILIDLNEATGLTEEIIYFKTPSGPLSRIVKQWKWIRLYKKAVLKHLQENGNPDLIHVHIPWKAGIPALWLSKNMKIPFLVSEHWGIYNKQIPLNYYERSNFFKSVVQKTFTKSLMFTTVSRYLAESILATGITKKYEIIPNVVDTSLFFYKQHNNKPFTFIHVSNMVALKNVDGILEAFNKLISTGIEDVRLILVGNKDQYYPKLAAKMGLLHRTVFFQGEVPYRMVAEEMQKAHCFILNSIDETASCVVSEALCCGLPVITTAVGGVPELIDETNSITVPVNDSDSLAIAMQRMTEEFSNFEPAIIANNASKKYSYSAISDKFDSLYDTQVR